MAIAQQPSVSNIDATEYEPFPLEGATEGDPQGRVHWLRVEEEGESTLYAGLFRGEPSTFSYVFSGDETFHCLEGAVRIEVEGAEPVELRPGDVASFPKGARSTWTILEPLKKFFVISG